MDDGEDDLQKEELEEVRAVLESCVYSVSVRHAIDSHRDAFVQLEKMQRAIWAKEEWRHQERLKKTASSGRSGGIGGRGTAASGGSTSSSSTSSSSSSSNSSSSSSRRRPAARNDSISEATDSKPESAVSLSHRMREAAHLGLGRVAGGAAGNSGAGGTQRRSRCKAGMPLQGAAAAPELSFATYAESLLPASPPHRSQFTFEVEKSLNMHANTPADVRQLQRRLSMLSSLQQETVKLEKQARCADHTTRRPPSHMHTPQPAWPRIASESTQTGPTTQSRMPPAPAYLHPPHPLL